jgi:hypothetical protein
LQEYRLPAFRFLLVSPEHGFCCKSLIAPLAPNTAHVFGHVISERALVRHNLTADAAGRQAQVNLIVSVAACSRAVRLVAHAAKETPATFVKLRLLDDLSLHGPGQRITCKFQVNVVQLTFFMKKKK